MKTERDLHFGRRRFLGAAGTLGLIACGPLTPSRSRAGSRPRPAPPIDLNIGSAKVTIDGRKAAATAVNGGVPGPLVRLREGTDAILRVTNHLDEDSSIHWHGIILPAGMDGVPGLSFAGIRPGETFTYRFPVGQNGTYWYHSHSGLQEQTGVYGPVVIDPAGEDPVRFDREFVILLSDWTFEDPHAVARKLKAFPGFYNFQKQTFLGLVSQARREGLGQALAERVAWRRMRMDPTDLADVTGFTYTYLMNGRSAAENWTGIFRPGERVRLRLINASAMTYFDVRIPGLPMTVVQADGQNVEPVETDELRVAVAETYDVVVEPQAERAYCLFAETMDRSGFARGTLTPRTGMDAPPPARRRPHRLTMADMGMHPMPAGGGHAAHAGNEPDRPMSVGVGGGHAGHGAVAEKPMAMAGGGGDDAGGSWRHGPDEHGPGNASVATYASSRLHEPGNGLGSDGWRALAYTDLRRLRPARAERPPAREIELHLTGNMERYMWSFDGEKFSEVDGPIHFRHGERLRLILVNDTMMDHPIHLHGMWMELENGHGRSIPRKHTISVKPAERLSALIDADAPGSWAFHCHLLFHMHMGMFRVVTVS